MLLWGYEAITKVRHTHTADGINHLRHVERILEIDGGYTGTQIGVVETNPLKIRSSRERRIGTLVFISVPTLAESSRVIARGFSFAPGVLSDDHQRQNHLA